ncbi:MAG TPA: DsbA family oxidoreductase [Alphaproteobacteria bacterium]|nr:DsbA family oxidoreductase [Alphaproteobacteria bacterium]
MKIDIISDTVCPWCFIGKRRLERAIAMRPEMVPEVNWYPFQLNPEIPEEGIERELYLSLKFGGIERAKEIYRAVGEASASEDLDFNLSAIKRMPNSLRSHRLLHFSKIKNAQHAVVENLFRSYFFHGTDIGSVESLLEIAKDSGLDPKQVRCYLESDEDLELVRNQDIQSRKMGVSGVPCFIIADEYAISGAQEPEVFLQVFDAAKQLNPEASLHV